MKIRFIKPSRKTILACFAAGFFVCDAWTGSLEENFVSPPVSARPQVWWHWMNGNISREGIADDLEAMKRVGIGGAHIFNVQNRIPHGPVQVGSPEWLDLVKYAAGKAKRLGMELAIHDCAGYSSSGGPWVTPENSMKTVVFSEKTLTGPGEFKGVLSQPSSKRSFYRDIAVLAFPTPVGELTPMAAAAPVVTINGESGQASLLTDGAVSTSVSLKPDAAAPVLLEFADPFSARLFVLRPDPVMRGRTGRRCRGRVEVSDDGKMFRPVAEFTMQSNCNELTVPFAPVAAKFFQVSFTEMDPRLEELLVGEIELSAKVGIESWANKIFLDRGKCPETVSTKTTPNEVVRSGEMIDLTAAMEPSGFLSWEIPDGNWTLLRIGYTSTARENHPAPEEARGLECDKLSKKSVQHFWDGMMGDVLSHLGGLAGDVESGLNTVVVDSYEVGSQNWTAGFEKEFQERCGYDLMRFLPVFSGRVVDSLEVTERFMWDFRRTVADLFSENYSGTLAELAKTSGLKFALEPYGNSPSDDFQYGRSCDLPMGEFWSGSNGSPGNAKFAASVGHVYGRPVIGAESFTAVPAVGRWQIDPAFLKGLGDSAYCAGINRIIYHRFAHQPWENRNPGMTMGQWGMHFERTVTWWEQSRAWLEYQARCQYLLQQGQFVADLCFYAGEDAPMGMPSGIAARVPPGYDYDVCNADALRLMSVENGIIRLPSGMKYRVLVLPQTKTMTLDTLKTIERLVQSGATVIGRAPESAPGLRGYPDCDEQVRQIAARLWPDKISGISPAEALSTLGVTPDFHCSVDNGRVRWIHRQLGDDDLYFVANQTPEVSAVECTFRVRGKAPELWHPERGLIEPAPVYAESESGMTVSLELEQAESVFVIFRKPIENDHVVSVKRLDSSSSSGSKDLVILKAEYRAIPEESNGVTGSVDVAARLAGLVKNGRLYVQAGNALAGKDPAGGVVKELCVDYRYQGSVHQARVREHHMLTLPPVDLAKPVMPRDHWSVNPAGDCNLTAWKPGAFQLNFASGGTCSVETGPIPGAVEISGPWNVKFPPHCGAPASVELDRLISWTDHSDRGVKYFSGTATYLKTFDWTASANPKERYMLDLGRLKNLAEVTLNGSDLGILWKVPFRVDVTDAIRQGENRLEVKITNLWPNRLIGDEFLPEDCEWQGPWLKEWPQWLLDGKPSPTGRFTFTTWKHWTKDDQPLPSGLFGPVRILTGRVVSPELNDINN